jgi:uncharacterized protein (DUF885 family)
VKRLPLLITLSLLWLTPLCAQPAADSDQALGSDFWTWRARTAQYTGDDVPRIERPNGVVRDWSAASIEAQRRQLALFDARWQKLEDRSAPVAQQVDHRLIGSALARVHWELDVIKRWQRDPVFYLEQTITPVGEILGVPGPYNEQQSREILARLNQISGILAEAEQNLASPPAPYARVAIDALSGIRAQLSQVAQTLAPHTTIAAAEWQTSADRAATALEHYRAFLQAALPTLPAQAAIGRDKYVWFLRNVALIPYTPEELVAQAEQEWRRAVAFEGLEENRNRAVPQLVPATTVEEMVARNRIAEQQTRDFLAQRGVLDLPPGLNHYELRPLPAYLAPLADFVETDDFTSATRLDQPGIRYVAAPSPSSGYFWIADAKDPRIQIVHEGTVGHHGQLCASWRHPDPIRRHYYDSGANEGIGFYAEEMMLQAGLYDASPHSREIVYHQMRLRAVRVIADVKVATGAFTPDQAAAFMQSNAPMDEAGARTEVAEMGETPGQKISYQTGKLQIVNMMEAARLKQGEQFSVRDFHDFVWLNGNVPIALQQWEYLGDRAPIARLDTLQ